MKLAVFDFDGTLIKTESLPFLLKQWGRLRYPKYRQIFMYLRIGGLYLRYKLGLNGNMSTEQIKKTAFAKFTHIFKGMTREEINSFFEKSADGLMGELNEHVVAEIKKANENGYLTVLLSGFYQELLEILAQRIGIDKTLGTNLNYKNNVIDLKKPLIIRTGTDKVVRIRKEFEGAGLKASCAYADSISDLELLELTGEPVAVSPDEQLRKIAEERSWRMIE